MLRRARLAYLPRHAPRHSCITILLAGGTNPDYAQHLACDASIHLGSSKSSTRTPEPLRKIRTCVCTNLDTKTGGSLKCAWIGCSCLSQQPEFTTIAASPFSRGTSESEGPWVCPQTVEEEPERGSPTALQVALRRSYNDPSVAGYSVPDLLSVRSQCGLLNIR
jgi:hypothetical protein